MPYHNNNITTSQNRDGRLDLLRAQRVYYGRVKRLQTAFLVLALALPWVGALWGAGEPQLQPLLVLVSIALLLGEIGFATRVQRNWVKTAARIQEQFDTEVLELPWNQFVVGSRVDPEEIRSVTRKPIASQERAELEDWYAKHVEALPLPLARLVCQRTNIAYDMNVRKAYGIGLIVVALLLFFYLLYRGVNEELSFVALLLTVFVPFMPLAAYVLREHRKQSDTVESLTTLKSEVDKLWSKALKSPNSTELAQDSRCLQDAIYRNRTSNPLVYDWVYWLVRKFNEDLALHAAQTLVAEAQRSLTAEEERGAK